MPTNPQSQRWQMGKDSEKCCGSRTHLRSPALLSKVSPGLSSLRAICTVGAKEESKVD